MLLRIVCFSIFGIVQLLNTDGSITAVISKDVVLPCTFRPTQLSEIVLHWMRKLSKKTIVVHSFYRMTDQLSNQDPNYKGRTKLFISEIMKGNASLHLTGINKIDEGEYQCYISTSEGKQERNILLQVAAESKNLALYPPNMLYAVTEGVNIICSASGAYPKPSLQWQDENGSDLTNDSWSEGSIDPEELYNIKSILKINQTSNTTYKCNIKNERLQQSWTASWKMQGTLKEKESQTIIITCNYSANIDQNLTITWKFRNTETSLLVIICKSMHQHSDVRSNCTKEQLEMLNNQKSSSLVFHRVTLEDAGEYTCEIRAKDTMQVFTYILKIDLQSASSACEASLSTCAPKGLWNPLGLQRISPLVVVQDSAPHEESQRHRYFGIIIAILALFVMITACIGYVLHRVRLDTASSK